MAGATLPAWSGPGVTTAWYGLPLTRAARPAAPVVVTLTGPVPPGAWSPSSAPAPPTAPSPT